MTWRSYLAVLGVAAGVCVAPACYSTGDGSAPLVDKFYFPVGLAVSPGGNVLYAVNSDFDLQYNGGTVQAYDLFQIRRDVLQNILFNGQAPNVPYSRPNLPPGSCPSDPAVLVPGSTDPQRQLLGETCSPPTQSWVYKKRNVVIGAFATDLQLSQSGDRLYMPVRGDASLTYVDVDPGGPDPYRLDCNATPDPNAASDGRTFGACNSDHHAGSDPNYPSRNTRHITMPGEPFGMAQSEDGESIVITHQNDTKVSLFSTGILAKRDATGAVVRDTNKRVVAASHDATSLDFVLDGTPVGGNGVVAVPHPIEAFPGDPSARPRAAYLETFRAAAELDLLRYYSDQTNGVTPAGVDVNAQSSLHRPFLLREAAFSLTANASGADSRGIAIDDTPRRACKQKLTPSNPPTADDIAKAQACARIPARVFFANRTPASLILGEIGEPSTTDSTSYDPDRLLIYGNVPLTTGPSKLYLAPIIDGSGKYALRVFIVCFDSATIFVWDPIAGQLENIIRVGVGPFAMAFDPFDMDEVAVRASADPTAAKPAFDTDPNAPKTRYRFAYVASFTKSFVQVLDLDQRSAPTFERVVYTLGEPTFPKGTQ